LYGISRRYGASIENILKYNPTADAGLEIGQILKVPYAVKKVQRNTGGTTVHTVAVKETMYSISRLYGVTVDEIKSWNGLTGNALSIGQQLTIRKGSAPATASPSPSPVVTTAAGSKKGTHTVAAKETMFSISRQYGITVQQLKEWNKLEGNDISIGQELVVSSPAAENTSNENPTIAKTIPPVTATNPAETAPTATPSTTTESQQAPVTPPVATKPEPKEQTIRISESVKNTNEILQAGLAELIEGTSGNRKYLALHRTAPIGTIMKVRNEMNNREVFVRVMGKLPDTAVNSKLVIKISKSAYDRLGAIDQRFRVEVTYYK
jgi:LysM repeat protein